MGQYKVYVYNKARPEGCIAEHYLDDECLTFISKYLHNVPTREHMEVLEKDNVSNIQFKHDLELPRWFEERIPDTSFSRGTTTKTSSVGLPSLTSVGLPLTTTGEEQVDGFPNSLWVGSDHSIGCANNNIGEIEELPENENDLVALKRQRRPTHNSALSKKRKEAKEEGHVRPIDLYEMTRSSKRKNGLVERNQQPILGSLLMIMVGGLCNTKEEETKTNIGNPKNYSARSNPTSSTVANLEADQTPRLRFLFLVWRKSTTKSGYDLINLPNSQVLRPHGASASGANEVGL
ncbi:hypothetical protein ACH5RR_018414 [Cinchona calisaya]|uniref:DUF4218 domain-containing protein n=1 Tax=Cinchona calisaya TaxID=153742 RepID=A0ABD2ZLE0_9GENT